MAVVGPAVAEPDPHPSAVRIQDPDPGSAYGSGETVGTSAPSGSVVDVGGSDGVGFSEGVESGTEHCFGPLPFVDHRVFFSPIAGARSISCRSVEPVMMRTSRTQCLQSAVSPGQGLRAAFPPPSLR